MNRVLRWTACSIAAGIAALASGADAFDAGSAGGGEPVAASVAGMVRGESPRPKLVIAISIDQFRADYLLRMGDLFLPAESSDGPGGFRYLMTKGAYFVNARYEHFPLFTGPGHAVIMTGGSPYKTGIIGNEWWDRRARRAVYCVEDDDCTVVGAGEGSKARPMGPKNLRCSTVGDELELAMAGNAKTVSLALKDRAAILMGGHATDLAIWFDTAGGRWISSSAFCEGGQLPQWVQALDDEHVPDQMLGRQWTPSIAPEILAKRTLTPKPVVKNLPPGFGFAFPHSVDAEKIAANYKAFTLTPAANEFVLQTATRAIAAEGLGADATPDVLTISLSTNDYVGHAFGPYSPEALDLTVRTDRALAAFIRAVDKAVGLKNVAWALTADHGVPPIPEDAAGDLFDFDAGRFNVGAVIKTVETALTSRFGQPAGGTWYSTDPANPKESGAFVDGFFMYLSPAAIEKAIGDGRARSRREFEQAACDAINGANIPGVYGCYGKTQILEGAVADNDLKRHLARAVHPQLSGDLIVLPEQFFIEDPIPEGHATTHGTPYSYDVHVPVIVCFPGVVRPGVYAERVSPADIAPTLSLLLGIEFPSACDGEPLSSALGRAR